jgi:hypothetical protein
MVGVAASAFTEKDRTTLVPGWQLKIVLCAALGNNVFEYGHRAAADQMRTSWEKLVQFVGTNYWQDISNELKYKIPVIHTKPVHTREVLARHAI